MDPAWLLLSFPFYLASASEADLDAFSVSVGSKCSRGESKGICAYHTTLSIRRQELAARGSVGESTCIQSVEEEMSERNSARIVGGGEGEKKLAPAKHLVSGRFWSFSQDGSIVFITSSSLFVCFYMHQIYALFLARGTSLRSPPPPFDLLKVSCYIT